MPATENDRPALTHHALVLFDRPPDKLELRYEGVSWQTPPPAGSVAVVPSLLMALWHLNRFPFYGTTLLISVGVALETMRQIDSQLMMRNYEGFLK